MSAPRRLALFDLDGTLVDSAPDIADAVDRALTRHGHSAIGEQRVRGYIGDGAARLMHRALTGSREGEADAGIFAAAYASFIEAYTAGLCVRTRVYAAVEEVLGELHGSGWTLGVVTNKPARFTTPLLARVGLRGWFGIVLSGDSLALGKPDPEPLLHAARWAGAAVGDSLLVGDSAVDMVAARRARMHAVGAAWGYSGRSALAAAGADALLGSMAELPAALRELGFL